MSGWCCPVIGGSISEMRLICGDQVFPLKCGLPRPDVARVHRRLKGANLSGFKGSFNLMPGEYRMQVEAAIGSVWHTVRTARTLVVDDQQAGRVVCEYWLRRQKRTAPRGHATDFDRPFLSIVMLPDPNAPPTGWDESLASVRHQSVQCSEVLAGSGTPPEASSGRDPQIRLHKREPGETVSETLDALLRATRGEWVLFLGCGDTLAPEACATLQAAANDTPLADMFYFDTDRIDADNRHHDPYFKPPWSPDLLESAFYTGRAAAYRRDAVLAAGGFTNAPEGAELYDLALRLTERTDRVVRLPRLLYHQRHDSGGSLYALSSGDHFAHGATRALEERLRRTARTGSAEPDSPNGTFRVTVIPVERPLVSIILPTAGFTKSINGNPTDLLVQCVESILDKTNYQPIEIVVVDNGDLSPAQIECLDRCGCRRVSYLEPGINLSAKTNLGVRHARGTYLLLLNDDVAMIHGEWLERMLEHFAKPGVGVVGAKLLYENDTIQHAGVVHLDGFPDHVRRGFPRQDHGYFASTCTVRNYLAVTLACGLTPKRLYEQVGGFDESLPSSFPDVDYCLKICETGHRVVYTPHAELYHYESLSRDPIPNDEERARFLSRWSGTTRQDPYYESERFTPPPPDFQLWLP